MTDKSTPASQPSPAPTHFRGWNGKWQEIGQGDDAETLRAQGYELSAQPSPAPEEYKHQANAGPVPGDYPMDRFIAALPLPQYPASVQPSPARSDMLDVERAKFEALVNADRTLPAEVDFSRTKSPSGRDEYKNSHLESCWYGYKLAAQGTQPKRTALHVETIDAAYRAADSVLPYCNQEKRDAVAVRNEILNAIWALRTTLVGEAQEAAPSGDDLHKSAQDLLNCCDGLPIDTDEATAEVLTAFDRTRSRLKKALARRATAGNAAPTEAQAFEFLAEYDEIRGDEGLYTLTSDDKWVIRNFLIEMFDDVASPAAAAAPGDLLRYDCVLTPEGKAEMYASDNGAYVWFDHVAPFLASNAGAAPADAESLTPAGWQFSTADFSCVASGRHQKGYVTLVRDAAGFAEFHKLCQNDGFDAGAFQLYIYGTGATLREAIADAARVAPSNNSPVGAPQEEE